MFVVLLVLVVLGAGAFRLLWKGNRRSRPSGWICFTPRGKSSTPSATTAPPPSSTAGRKSTNRPAGPDAAPHGSPRREGDWSKLVIQSIPDSDPIASMPWLKAGQIELARHNARGAEAAAQRSVALGANQIQAYRELAYLYAVQRRREDCDAQFRALAKRTLWIACSPSPGAKITAGSGTPTKRVRFFGRFVEFDLDDRLSRLALATTQRLANLLEVADETLRPLPDSDQDALAVRAEIAIDRGEIDRLRFSPMGVPIKDDSMWFAVDWLSLDKEAAGAADYFRAALHQDPADPTRSGAWAWLRVQGDPRAVEFSEAAQRYEEYSALQNSTHTLQTDPKLFTKLGGHCESVHCTDLACVWYDLSVKRDPLDEQAREALSRPLIGRALFRRLPLRSRADSNNADRQRRP